MYATYLITAAALNLSLGHNKILSER